MYKSLEEICEMTTKEGKPFWKIVQEDDCKEQGIQKNKGKIRMIQPDLSEPKLLPLMVRQQTYTITWMKIR